MGKGSILTKNEPPHLRIPPLWLDHRWLRTNTIFKWVSSGKSFSSLNHIEVTFELQMFMGLAIETLAMMRFFTFLPNWITWFKITAIYNQWWQDCSPNSFRHFSIDLPLVCLYSSNGHASPFQFKKMKKMFNFLKCIYKKKKKKCLKTLNSFVNVIYIHGVFTECTDFCHGNKQTSFQPLLHRTAQKA